MTIAAGLSMCICNFRIAQNSCQIRLHHFAEIFLIFFNGYNITLILTYFMAIGIPISS